jgi:hypothetical protein
MRDRQDQVKERTHAQEPKAVTSESIINITAYLDA